MVLSSSKPAASLSAYDRLSLRFYYLNRSFNYDSPENQVGWRSRENQEARFKALMGMGELEGQRILDLGCGLGCLYGYLKANGWKGEYTGIDLLDMMVKGAQKRFPGAAFEQRDILKDPPTRKWDTILISGIFNHRMKNNWDWIERTLGLCLSMAEKGVAFNLLDGRDDWKDADLFYADPKELERKAALWSGGKYKIVTGYMPYDLTVYLYSPGGTKS